MLLYDTAQKERTATQEIYNKTTNFIMMAEIKKKTSRVPENFCFKVQ